MHRATCIASYQEHFGLDADQVTGKTVAEVWGAEAFGFIKPKLDRGYAGELVTYEACDVSPRSTRPSSRWPR